jgi:cyclic pyranopterin phosphate synthase
VSESLKESLTDRFGRTVDYLRISVTDRCDLRCVYCMSENMTFLPREQLLTLEEIIQIGRCFTELGVSKIRITGGEPLHRRNILSVFEAFGELDGLNDLTLTTNGTQLHRFAKPLADASVTRVNISLDTLDADRFKALTRNGDIDKVFNGIDAAQKVGFKRIKLNAVVLKIETMMRFVRSSNMRSNEALTSALSKKCLSVLSVITTERSATTLAMKSDAT